MRRPGNGHTEKYCNGVNFGGYQFLAFWRENPPPSAGDHHGSRDL